MINSQGIEGLPPGIKVVAVDREPEPGEYYLSRGMFPNSIVQRPLNGGKYHKDRTIIACDNDYGVVDLETLPIPSGYRRVKDNWYRVPDNFSEIWLGTNGQAEAGWTMNRSRIILEKVPPKKKIVMEIDLEPGENDAASLFGYSFSDILRTRVSSWRVEECD